MWQLPLTEYFRVFNTLYVKGTHALESFSIYEDLDQINYNIEVAYAHFALRQTRLYTTMDYSYPTFYSVRLIVFTMVYKQRNISS